LICDTENIVTASLVSDALVVVIEVSWFTAAGDGRVQATAINDWTNASLCGGA